MGLDFTLEQLIIVHIYNALRSSDLIWNPTLEKKNGNFKQLNV